MEEKDLPRYDDLVRLLDALKYLHWKIERIRTVHLLAGNDKFWEMADECLLLDKLLDARTSTEQFMRLFWGEDADKPIADVLVTDR